MSRSLFDTLFRSATDNLPYDYQRRLACGERNGRGEDTWLASGTLCRSQLISIPTGLGKTAAVTLAWLWNRVECPDEESRNKWPRRLVYCLPMRTLVEQTEKEICKWLGTLLWKGNPADRRGKIGVHVLMGGEDSGEWDIYPEENAVLIGTQDMLLSRALNRGYGMSRYRWPMHFGLLNNDCLWVMDETQLMGVGVETSAQLDGFRGDDRFGVCGTCPTWWMSATLDDARLVTVDHPKPADGWSSVQLENTDLKREDVGARVSADKILAPCDFSFSASNKGTYAKRLTDWLLKEHQPGSLTLVILNNVSRAQEVYSQLLKAKTKVPLALIHSRFRPGDRELHEELLHAQGERIVVATQAVEAGVDVSARTLITELAPWSSLVQRFGRCNRRGEFTGNEARIFWIDIEAKDQNDGLVLPYDFGPLVLAREALRTIDNAGPESLQGIKTQNPRVVRPVIRRKDIIELFDTTPDLAGLDLDISRYIRDGDDTDVQVFWRDLGGRSPDPNETEAANEELCRVSVTRFREFLDRLLKTVPKMGAPKLRAYVWNPFTETWEASSSARAGVTYLLDTQAGGYSKQLGWFGVAKFDADVSSLPRSDRKRPAGYSENRQSFQRTWVSLPDHSHHVVNHMGKLLPLIPTQLAEAFTTAARWHDVGKAHPAFQKMLTRDDAQRTMEIWAKSANTGGRCERQFFRHELASALAWLQTCSPDTPERDLVAYLIAAHHGKVRLSIRSMPGEEPPSETPDARIARGIVEGDVIGPIEFGGASVPAIAIELSLMELGQSDEASPSWLARMIALRDRVGLFRLAYFEGLLRTADMRASAAESIIKGGNL